MKQIVGLVILCFSLCLSAQTKNPFSLDANVFYGTILEHNEDIPHLITGHPTGFLLSYNKKTFGKKAWTSRYNYPDYGVSFIYQDLKNQYLGDNYSIYAHYNFYFFKRNLMFRVGQGIAYNTNPYDKERNFRNIAYGTPILSSTYLMLNYKKENVFKGLGFQAGISVIHYSNANVKAPNSSTNTLAIQVGTNYVFDYKNQPDYIASADEGKFTERIKYNVVLRHGINESDIIGSGQYPFFVFSAYADKRINRKSAIQLGTDVFFSQFLKQQIKYKAIAFPEDNTTGDEDYKRVGVFVGHELFISKTSIITQLGYYAYYPFPFEGRVYNRLGIKRYVGDKFYGVVSLKSHGARAEAVEFGIGIRL